MELRSRKEGGNAGNVGITHAISDCDQPLIHNKGQTSGWWVQALSGSSLEGRPTITREQCHINNGNGQKELRERTKGTKGADIVVDALVLTTSARAVHAGENVGC